MNPKESKFRELLKIARSFEKPSNWSATFQLVNTIIPLFAAFILGYILMPQHPVMGLLFSFVFGLFIVRAFIIQHDCGHGSFMASKSGMETIGLLISIITATPFAAWRRAHAVHHASSGNLDNRGIGDCPILTIDEYRKLSTFQKIQYRLYRNCLTLVFVGPIFMFLFLHRIPGYFQHAPSKKSVHFTNALLLLLALCVFFFLDWKTFLLVYIPGVWLATSIGSFLFYVQHQYEDAYWEREVDWDYYTACFKGSSYIPLPKILQWFSGSIGFHHVHHFAPKVPNYKLEECHNAIAEMVNPKLLTIREAFSTLWLSLWDEEGKKLISYKDLANYPIKERNSSSESTETPSEAAFTALDPGSSPTTT